MKNILITGCAGFIGENLSKKLLKTSNVIGIDNFYSSSKQKINDLKKHDNFKFFEHNIIEPFDLDDKVDIIYNLACPASPPIYQKDPIYTLKTNFIGTMNLLELARKKSSIFIQASTSEVYGDPEKHPQQETYFGNVNTVGLRSCYDEGKRVAETLCNDYSQKYSLDTRIIRIFNTYGPGMDINDGRVISNFLVNIIKNTPLEIYGNGNQTRSFCYIDDLLEGLIRASKIKFDYPINLGNDKEISLNQLVNLLKDKFGKLKVKHLDSVSDDPKSRKPSLKIAKKTLNWSPSTSIDQGLLETYQYFKKVLDD